jgi:ParB family chromosome partitioning protein
MSLTHEIETISLNKLKASDANVRKTGRDANIEQLAASIAAHGLLHPLTVTPETGKSGEPTGKFGVIAGGRRLAALKLLAGRKTLPKTAPIPCVTIEDNGAEISLAENVGQAPMHPADQFEAFAALQVQGLTAEDIGARFGLSARVVKQRLRLGAASPRLMARYRDDEITLDQLMAFCLTDDHAAQERVWESLSWNKDPATIRRLLTEGQVPLNHRAALFVGIEAYEEAGGTVLRDLLSQDEGQGYITDLALLEQLVVSRLETIAVQVQAEGWKWVQASPDFDYQETAGMQRVFPSFRELTDEEQAQLDALERAFDELPDDHSNMEAEAARLEAEIEALRGEAVFDPDDIACGGAWVSIGHNGQARIERGFIRPQDHAAEEGRGGNTFENADIPGHPAQGGAEADTARLADRLLSNLCAHRTAALRHRLATQPDIAYLAVLHAFVLQSFYLGEAHRTCLDINLRQAAPATHADNLDVNPAARDSEKRHQHWAKRLPQDAGELWSFIAGQHTDERTALLAHSASLTLDALHHSANGRHTEQAHADQLATALDLDMTHYWQPTEESYFKRITKAQISEAVREAKGDAEAGRMAGMKKPDMAKRAERLLSDSGWLPEVFRSPEPLLEQTDAQAA